MTPEDTTVARSGDKSKRLLGMFVDRRIEFANDVVENAWRHGEDSAAVAAVSRVTDAIRRVAREEHRLVHIRSDSTATEMSRESTVTHQHDVVPVRKLFTARTTARDVATVVVDADDRALIQRPKNYFFIALVGHKCYRTTPQT